MTYAYIVLDPELFFSATISVWVCSYTKNFGLVNKEVSRMSRAGEIRLFSKSTHE
jgi:hypothetical protein